VSTAAAAAGGVVEEEGVAAAAAKSCGERGACDDDEERGFPFRPSLGVASSALLAAPVPAVPCFRPIASVRRAALEASRDAEGGTRSRCICFWLVVVVVVVAAAIFVIDFSFLGSHFSPLGPLVAAAGKRTAFSFVNLGKRAA